MTRAVDETLFGTFKALKVTKVTLTGVTPKGTFYIDGVAQPVRVKAGQAVLTFRRDNIVWNTQPEKQCHCLLKSQMWNMRRIIS